MKLANKFVKFVVKELNMKSLPSNIKFEGDDYSAEHLTFGTYNPSTDEIVIVKGNRHPIDVLRTLAHEMVHHKQREDGKEMNGEDGSDVENEANAKAGELMRKFRQQQPEIFTKQPGSTDKLKEIQSVVKTGTVRKIDEQFVDVFTAKLLLTVARKLHPEKREVFTNKPINEMVAIAYKMVTK